MNNKLIELYESKWNNYYKELKNVSGEKKPTKPLLLKIDDVEGYESADLRIMVFGQETNGWYEMSNEIIDLCNEYQKFFSTKNLFVNYSSQFCNGLQKFKSMIFAKHPNKKIRFVWNNINKTGVNGKGAPPEYIYKLERDYFSVINEEIQILKPDILIFFTGPTYDQRIFNVFGNISLEKIPNFNTRQIAKFSINNNNNCFRTYHPNYLYRIRRAKPPHIKDYFNAIIDSIVLK